MCVWYAQSEEKVIIELEYMQCIWTLLKLHLGNGLLFSITPLSKKYEILKVKAKYDFSGSFTEEPSWCSAVYSGGYLLGTVSYNYFLYISQIISKNHNHRFYSL